MNHGNLVTITAQQVLVMFLLILVGYLAVRVKVLGAEARQNFSSLLINIVVPAMIVDSYLIPFDPAILSNLLRTALASAAVLFAGLGIALLATRRMKDPNRPLLRFAITFSNAAYMGFPLIEALFGAEGLLYASIFNTFFNILIWTAGTALLAPGSQEKHSLGQLLKKPALLAVALGLILYLGQVPVPDLISTPLSLLGGMNTPLSMLITGIIIATSDLRSVIRRGSLWYTLFLRMAVVPAAALLLCLATGTGGMVGRSSSCWKPAPVPPSPRCSPSNTTTTRNLPPGAWWCPPCCPSSSCRPSPCWSSSFEPGLLTQQKPPRLVTGRLLPAFGRGVRYREGSENGNVSGRPPPAGGPVRPGPR